MDLSVRRLRSGFQLGYTAPHQINHTLVYPLRSQNGSIVVIYAHEYGIRVIWYAGRSFKAPPSTHTQSNGAGNSNQLVIDLDDDDESNAVDAEVKPGEFEEEDDEVDPLHPYRKVLRHLDISLPSAAIRLACPQLQTNGSFSTDSEPQLTHNNIIIVAACEDCSIQLLTFPLLPPRLDQTSAAVSAVKRVKIGVIHTHQDLVEDLALRFSADEELLTDEIEEITDASAVDAAESWSVLVASISAANGGQLLIHRIPLQTDGTISGDSRFHVPYQRQLLRAPVTGARVYFNPSLPTSDRHANLLVSLRDASCVKIYQVIPPRVRVRERRGSTATSGSESSDTHTTMHRSGRFAISLLPPFTRQESPSPTVRRKRVLDANWIAGGRAIVAILEDGEWGIWDIEAVSPAGSAQNGSLLQGQENVSGLHGGAVSRFAVGGNLSSAPEVPKKSTSKKTTAATDVLAPMTPHTRKIRSVGLFQGQSTDADRSASEFVQGQICVTEQANGKSTDNLVVISFNNLNYMISSVQSYWRADLSNRAAALRPSLLPLVSVGSETMLSFALLPTIASSLRTSNAEHAQPTPPSFLIASDHHLAMFVTPLPETQDGDVAGNLEGGDPFDVSLNTDQVLLNQGDLDIDGMDRILEGMNGVSSNRPQTQAKAIFGKSVGFRVEDDDDVPMGSPTPIRSTKPRSMRPAGTPRRIFT